MDHLSQFITHHWAMCGAFVIVILAIIMTEARIQGTSGGSRLTPQMVTHLINREMAVVVDIREANGFLDGHIVGAMNIPMSNWDTASKKLTKFKSKPVVIIDATGQKAQGFANKLKQAGFDNVKVLGGGVNAWRNAKLPLVKGNK
jgi:rhodanese-related sulfurtransferase